MIRFRGLIVAAAGALSIATVTSPVHAVVVNFSVPEEIETIELTNGLDATVTLNPASDSVDLTPGTTETVLLSGGSVSLFQPSTSTGDGELTRALTVSTSTNTPPAQSISQEILISQNPGNPPFQNASASATLNPGAPVTYDLGAYSLTVTPILSSRAGQEGSSFPIFNSADFLLTVVPEPTGGLLVLAGGALLAARRRRA